MQIIFLSGTKCFWVPQYENRFLIWHKKIGSAQNILGLVKGQGTSPFTGCKMFCAVPNFLRRTINLSTYIFCHSQKFCARPKKWFAFSKIGFCVGTKVFEEAINAVKCLGWLKRFSPSQNILRPVKGQGIKIDLGNQNFAIFGCLSYT